MPMLLPAISYFLPVVPRSLVSHQVPPLHAIMSLILVIVLVAQQRPPGLATPPKACVDPLTMVKIMGEFPPNSSVLGWTSFPNIFKHFCPALL